MHLPAFITDSIDRWAARVRLRRTPDMIIGGPDAPYLERWYAIPRNRFLNVYLHRFRRSDDDRALHDHPWFNASILLRGGYVEIVANAPPIERNAGDVVIRRPTALHRVMLTDSQPVETLFITGPRVRVWGFLCPHGWRPWREFVDPTDPGAVGPGCD